MEKNTLIILLFAFILMSFQVKKDEIVQINKQFWMKDNLNVASFRNGDPIFHAKTHEEWDHAYKNKIPAWCYYDNNPENGEIYGKLYNCYAVIDERKLAPIGFHIPSKQEWNELINFLGGKEVAAIQLKHSDTLYWKKSNVNNTNNSQFSAKGGGYRDNFVAGIGGFQKIKMFGIWWTSTQNTNPKNVELLVEKMTNFNSRVSEYGISGCVGYSVRCIKDF